MIGSFEPTQEASSDSIICVRGHPVVRPFAVHAFWKRQNETRNRSLTFKNAFPPRETDQNFLKTPSRGGKWGKFSEKRLPAAGNGKKSQKNGFLRREGDKIARKTPSCGGKAVKFAGDRFPAAGKGGVSHTPPERFPTETISRILINRIGTGCLKCPPLLSPLRCIWGVSITPYRFRCIRSERNRTVPPERGSSYFCGTYPPDACRNKNGPLRGPTAVYEMKRIDTR